MTATGRLEVLDRAECERLLRTGVVGRLGVNRRGHGPLVVPVNYVVDRTGAIVFRTAVGTKLARITRGAVSFQVDEADAGSATGWSVLVDGLAHEVDLDAAVGVDCWLAGPLAHAVRVVPTTVTGRRVVAGRGPSPLGGVVGDLDT